ncbi:hypothetical protein HID58_005277 [Brassica napus]|uniref:Uncharacterized protein n=1 Tax=Brassica napus TaxID=3708 RepID=A0ABQ8E832_BRANA|nr:hypothetical protein HID58_005277 [Brassica napus]
MEKYNGKFDDKKVTKLCISTYNATNSRTINNSKPYKTHDFHGVEAGGRDRNRPHTKSEGSTRLKESQLTSLGSHKQSNDLRTRRGRALKTGESYDEGERLQTAQDPLPICEEEELTGTESTKRTAVQRDRSSNRVNLHDGLYIVYLQETEKRNPHKPVDSKPTTKGLENGEAATLSIPDEPYGPRSDPDLRKDTLLREISDWHHQSLQLATPCFSSSGLTDARHCRRKSPVNQRNQRRKTCRYRWNGEGWRTEAKGRKKKKEGWRRRTEQQTCRRSSAP